MAAGQELQSLPHRQLPGRLPAVCFSQGHGVKPSSAPSDSCSSLPPLAWARVGKPSGWCGRVPECCSQHEGEAGKRSCFYQLMFGPRVSGRAWLRVDSEPCAACSQPGCKESSPALDCRRDSALCPGFSVSALPTCGAAHSLLWGVLGTVGCLAASLPPPPRCQWQPAHTHHHPHPHPPPTVTIKNVFTRPTPGEQIAPTRTTGLDTPRGLSM